MHALRTAFSRLTRATPVFRGKGRLVLAADRLLTNHRVRDSFEVVDTVNGFGRFIFDLRPWGTKFGYYYGDVEREFTTLVRKLYRGGTFVDVGSCVGLYPVCMGDLVRSAGCRIVSIEPVPANRAMQERNLALNGIKDIVDIEALAVGAGPGELRIHVCDDYGYGNAFSHPDGEIAVPVVSLDSLLARRRDAAVGFMKMDVEGFEPVVIEGARETIARDRPVIFSEFNRERMEINGIEMGPCWEFLMSLGYEAFRVARGELKRITEPGRVENIFLLPR